MGGDDTLVIGGAGDNDCGSAHVYERDPGGSDNLGQAAKLTASDGAFRGRFGFSVSISSDNVLICTPEDGDNGENSGSAYIIAPTEPIAWVYLPVLR